MRTLAIAACASLCASLAQAQTTVAGSTPGSFRVTESGAAEYRIPIRVPPGIAGMEPKLALVYNSQAGNGLLGVGWNLEGLSAITRCPRTMAQDGVRGAVNYDANDRYCLDGQRLMLVSAGATYGAPDTEYRTERESFTKVMAYGTAGNGPAWFKAWTKSGQIIEYGNTADSRIEAQGKTTVRVWAMNKVSDTKGNYFTATYTEDSGNGEFVVDRIDYTANGAGAAAASARFVYESRSDVPSQYQGGAVVRTTQRLARVAGYAGAVQVMSYDLAYTQTGYGGRSRLSSVTECGASAACLQPTSFEWLISAEGAFLNGAGQVLASSFSGTGWDAAGKFAYADVNADGCADFVFTGTQNLYAALSNCNGMFNTAAVLVSSFSGTGWDAAGKFTYIDVNADGCADFVFTGTQNLYVALSNCNGTFNTAAVLVSSFSGTGWDVDGKFTYTDVNGDACPDFNFTGNQTLYVALSNCNGTFATGAVYASSFSGTGWDAAGKFTYADFNRDGCADFVFTGTQYLYVALSNCNGSFATGAVLLSGFSGTGWDAPGKFGYADVNGDGCPDYTFTGTQNLYAALSACNGLFQTNAVLVSAFAGTGWDPDGRFAYNDVNGDGCADYVLTETHALYVARSRCNGLFETGAVLVSSFSGTGWAQTGKFGYFDASGRGRRDFVFTGASTLYVALADGVPGARVGTISGPQGSTTVAYKALTDNSVYTKDAVASYPLVNVEAPLYVVSSVSVSDGTGGTQTRQHAYGGAKAQLAGRGFLGFRWVEAIQDSTGLKLRTEYRQDWPYVGLPSVVKRTQSSGAVLSEVTNTFACTNPATGSACAVAAGNRYFPYVSQRVETANDLNGAALPTVTTATQYDSFGNATSVVVSAPGYTKSTSNTYANDTANWFLGRLTRSTVQSTTTP